MRVCTHTLEEAHTHIFSAIMSCFIHVLFSMDEESSERGGERKKSREVDNKQYEIERRGGRKEESRRRYEWLMRSGMERG